MPTITTVFRPPPLRDSKLGAVIESWLLDLQYLLPLKEVDTTGGGYAEALPAAGNDATTGRSAQNQEITYVKTSSDGNTFTLNGAPGGPYTLTAQWSFMKFKSNGSTWRKTG